MNIIFAGTPEFALPSLKALFLSEHRILAVYTQPDRPKGRGRRLLISPIKKFALEKGIPVCQPISFRNIDEQQKFAAWQADLLVVVAYGLILPSVVLKIPVLGCVNVHASLLPRWRGAAPIQRAILAGDKKTGISIMQMDTGLDTGATFHKISCNIEPTDTTEILQARLALLGAEALMRSLFEIQQNSYHLEPQDNNSSTYAKKIEKKEAVIDWTQSADSINRLIRAFNPKPVAYTFLCHCLLRVWLAEILDQTSDSLPGTILQVGKKGIDVMTGSGVLRLLQLQLPGGRCLAASTILNSKSHMFTLGNRLG